MSIGLGIFFFHFIHFIHIDFQFKIFFSFSRWVSLFFVCPKIKFYWFFPFSFGLVSIVLCFFFCFQIASYIFLGRIHVFFFDTSDNVFSIEFPLVFLCYSMSVSYTFHLMSLKLKPTDNNIGHTQAYTRPTQRKRNKTYQK